MESTNPPKKHHYIPAFYLRRWADSNNKVTEFSKPFRAVVSKTIMPERTGFQERLYELKGYEPELAQQIEENFFKPLDTKASNSLMLLHKHGDKALWDSESRSAWTQFILSLLLRCPEDIALFREWWHLDFVRTDDDEEKKYLAARTENDPLTFSDFIQQQPLSTKERFQFEVLLSLMSLETVGVEINNMHWKVLNIPDEAPELLTSDNPVIRTNSLRGEMAHLAVPIGPRQIFFASPALGFFDSLLRVDRIKLAKEVNRQIVEAAKRFVYARDDIQLRFIQNRFGKSPQPRLMENIVGRRKAVLNRAD